MTAAATGIITSSRPRGSAMSGIAGAADALTAFAQRLGFEAPDAQIVPGDRAALARIDDAERAAAQLAADERAAVHNTLLELLSLQYDPEAAVYADKLRELKRDSADTPDSFRYLVRKPGLIDGEDTFNVKACANQSQPFAEFSDPDENVIAVARGGVVLACKK